MNATPGRWIVFALGLLAVATIAGLAIRDSRGEGDTIKVASYTPWEEETLKTASLLPVQDGGRVKPLGTYASFTMLGLHGARQMEILGEGDKKVKIKPLAWMLDCLFRPELAKKLPTFRIDNSDVIEAVGIPVKGRRDRYSYEDLSVGLKRLNELASSYEQIAKRDPELLKPLEQQTLDLAYSIRTFDFLTGYMDSFRNGLLPGEVASERILNTSDTMRKADTIRADIRNYEAGNGSLSRNVELVLTLLSDAANASKYGLLVFPPASAEKEAWTSAGDRMASVFMPDPSRAQGESDESLAKRQEMKIKDGPVAVADIKALEDLARSVKDGQAAFREKFTAFEALTVARATERGEYRSVPLEASYFRTNWFIYALVWFLLATVTSAVMLFTGQSRAGRISMWSTVGLLVCGLICVMIPIGMRCVIMRRPPIGNLYDTIIFIDMALVIFALAVEGLTRKRFALGITPIVAAMLIVLARRFEVGEGKDHLDPLVAVLRSNYWLTTHVITITLGYAAGLITSLLSIVYVLLRALGLEQGDKSIRRSLTRAVYGCVCLTVLLSLIGTVLGGIWANDSWGRFWGWDPKENGALMIVLWSLAILHARAAGFIREWGLHLASLFGAIVVGFSWWHVNFLNVGLHNYGFAADKKQIIFYYYGIIGVFILIGAATCLFEWIVKSRPESAGQKAPPERPAAGGL